MTRRGSRMELLVPPGLLRVAAPYNQTQPSALTTLDVRLHSGRISMLPQAVSSSTKPGKEHRDIIAFIAFGVLGIPTLTTIYSIRRKLSRKPRLSSST